MLLDLSIRPTWRGKFVPDDYEMTDAALRVQEESYEKETVRIGPIEMHVSRHSPQFWGYWGFGYHSSDSDSDSDDSSLGGQSPKRIRTMSIDEWSLVPGDGCY